MTLFVVPLVEVAPVGATREMVTVTSRARTPVQPAVDGDLCDDSDAEQVDAEDPSCNMDFHAAQIPSVSCDDLTHTMTIVGEGTNNGVPLNFTAVGVDNGSTALGQVQPLT
jgi:hypothetical protein